jgi:hypothetical protein
MRPYRTFSALAVVVRVVLIVHFVVKIVKFEEIAGVNHLE